jgi:hypothetical protein
MEQLIKALPAILAAAADSPEVIETAAIAAWNHVAGDLLSKQTVATAVNNKVLVVAVADAVWKKQLEPMTPQLLFRLNAILGRSLVRRIEFRVDAQLLAQRNDSTRVTPNAAEELNENDVSLEIWSAAVAIKDKQLRKAFLKAATLSIRRRERLS